MTRSPGVQRAFLRIVRPVSRLGLLLGSLPGRILELPIHIWQQGISRWSSPRCRYHPTCSAYAVGALRQHGIVWGSVLAAWRVVRCNPWSLGGIDHPNDAWSPMSFHVKRPG